MFEQVQDLSLGAIARLLAFFYELPVVGGSYGLAIIMLTLTVMVALMPLTLKATRSTIKMTQMQPKIRQLQKKHKDDKQALNAEMMALYQSEGVNPVGGCLPMVAQLPVFLVLFRVLRGLTRRISGRPYFEVANEAHAMAGRPVNVSRNFDPAYLDHGSKLYTDLTNTDTMGFGPFDLGNSAWETFQTDFVKALPYLVLILFVIGTSFYQQKQISARRGNADEQLTQQQKTQQQLMKVLPLMSGAWSFVFPTGLVLYWATSNLFRIGQQAYITRSLYSGDGMGAQMLRQQEEDRKKSSESDDVEDDTDSDTDDSKGSGNGSRSKKAGSGKPGSGKGSGASGSGKAKRSRSASTNGSAGSNGNGSSLDDVSDQDDDSEPVTVGSGSEREQRWAERRAQRAKAAQRRSAASGSGSATNSSRITPKGTKPTTSKNKRKR